MRKSLTCLAALVLIPALCLAGAGVADVADTDPGLFLFMMIILIGFLWAIIGFLALVALAAIAFLLLAAMGVFTISAFVAWYRKSLLAGLKTSLYLAAGLIGIGGGAFGGWVYCRWLYPTSVSSSLLIWSALAGGLAALLICRLFLLLLAKLAERIAPRADY